MGSSFFGLGIFLTGVSIPLFISALGAEINQYDIFQKQFEGKKIFEGEEFKSIKVVKGGAPDNDYNAVDGISGGTITSDGVTDMLLERFNMYLPYIKKVRNEIEEEKLMTNMDSVLILNDSLIQERL